MLQEYFGSSLAFFLWVVMAMPGVIAGQKVAERRLIHLVPG